MKLKAYIHKLNPSWLLLVLLCLILLLRIDYSMFLYRPGIITSDEVDLLGGIKSAFEANFAQILPSPQAELLSGIVLGSKQILPDRLKEALINTSTIHIVVASGQNLTILSGCIIGLASLLGRKKAVLASIGANIFYSLLTGLQIPIIRAAIMNIFASLGILSGREAPVLFALLSSAILMLIYEPLWLFSVSFQLSFLASFAVMEFAPKIEARASWLPDLVKQDLIVSASAFLFTLPIIFENFQRVSLIGIIVNSLVLWTTPIVMASGGVVALISLLSLDLAAVLALLPGIFLTYLIYVVGLFNTLTPSVEVKPLGWIFWTGYYLLLLSLYFYAGRQKAS
jgi:competence protein ComEC